MPSPPPTSISAFQPLVCVVDFHHARGPEIEHVFASGSSDRNVPASDGSAFENVDLDVEDSYGFDPSDWSLIPYMALPDGAHATEEEFSYFSVVYRGKSAHRLGLKSVENGDHIMGEGGEQAQSVFGVACARQLDSAELLYRPAAVTRSAVQKAVVAITARPQTLGAQRERLRVVTRAWFAQRDFRDRDILQRFQESLVAVETSGDGEEHGFGLSLREMIRTFRAQTLVLFKCLLLQPKILFFGNHCERVCQVQFSLLSLIPGLISSLRDCADPRMNRYAETLKKPDGVRTSDRKSLLAYMGIPLQIFGAGSIFNPYTPLQKLDTLTDQGTKSYVVGSTNTLLFSQKERYCDVLINLDDNTVSILSPHLRPLLALSTADRRWIDSITQIVNDTWNDADPSHPTTHGFEGGEDFIRLQFEEYLMAMLSCDKYHSFLQTQKPGEVRALLADIEGDPSAEFVPAFLNAWHETQNYEIWDKITDAQLFDIVEPRHPCAGGLTIEDVQRRLARRVEELHLDERFNQTRDVVGRRLADGRETVASGINRLWADFEVMREAQRKRSADAAAAAAAASAAAPSNPLASTENATTMTTPPPPSSMTSRFSKPDLQQAQTSVAAASQRASAYISSWGSWASEKRKSGWRGGGTSITPVPSLQDMKPRETPSGDLERLDEVVVPQSQSEK